MGDRNLFAIGRSRLGLEDQLTEMLAYLWQERPDLISMWLRTLRQLGREGGEEAFVVPEGDWVVATQVVEKDVGRFDMTLEVPGAAMVVVESKLDSELPDEQLTRYLDYLALRQESVRALVSLTKHPPPRSPELRGHATEAGVTLVQTRWQELGRSIGDPAEQSVAGDFIRMLIEEKLVVPGPFSTDDWVIWTKGAAVLARLKVLINEARDGITQISPGLRASPRWGSDERWIYSGFSSDRLEIGLGFAANESPSRPSSAPIIWAYLKNPAIPAEAATSRARDASRKVPGAGIIWSGVPLLWRPAAEVLTAPDFNGQVRQAVEFVCGVAEEFQKVGYLPLDLPLRRPARPPVDA